MSEMTPLSENSHYGNNPQLADLYRSVNILRDIHLLEKELIISLLLDTLLPLLEPLGLS